MGNAVDPFSTIEKYGSDPLRWYMITNSSPWDNLKFDVDGVEEVRRKFFEPCIIRILSLPSMPTWTDLNTRKLMCHGGTSEIDRWIISVLNIGEGCG